MLVEAVRKYYEEEALKRVREPFLRPSLVGHCARQVWYQLRGYSAEPLNYNTLLKFRLGDLIESDLVDACVKCYPDFKAGEPIPRVVGGDIYQAYKQFEVTIGVGPGVSIVGHIDGYIEKKGKPYCIVDFKSAAAQSFDAVERTGDVGEGYVAQAHCYMKGMGVDRFLFVYYNKNLSTLTEIPVKWNQATWDKLAAKILMLANPNAVTPPREHEPNQKGYLPWQCGYCSYRQHCWPEAKMEFSKSGKPMFKV